MLTLQTVSFGSSAAIGISVVYTIDCYRPIAGEIVVSQVVFKCRLFLSPGRFSETSVLIDGCSSCHYFSHVILREPVGESGRLCRGVCRHGKLQFCHLGTVDSSVHLGQTDSCCHLQMAGDATRPLGRGPRDRRVGVSITLMMREQHQQPASEKKSCFFGSFYIRVFIHVPSLNLGMRIV